jgi:hypothetical protein
MRIRQILELLLLTGFVSGCWNLGIKGEAPGSLGNIDLLQSFTGQESESVIREFGLPDELLSDGDKQFMVYSAKSADTNLIMVMWIPIPVWAINDKENTIHCLRFELDSDNVVKEYRFKSKVMSTVVYPGIELLSYSNCQEVFWIWEGNWKEPIKLQKATDFPSTWKEIEKQRNLETYAEREKRERRLKQFEVERQQQLEKLFQQAKQGNADAQLALFKRIRYQNPKESLRWLCKSADLGNEEARFIMAKAYEYGGYIGIRKGGIQQNNKLAYVWHALSGLYDEEDLQFFADRHLTAAELSDANKLLREWQPGQCEKDLGLVSYTE